MPKKKATDKEKEKDKAKEVAPAYDSGPWPPSASSSSAAAAGGDTQARAFMEAFMAYAKEKEEELPAGLQSFFQPNAKDQIKSQQKKLNRQRNLLQKIDAKKRAIQRDQDQWIKWTTEMKEHIACQKQRRQEQEDKLKKELQELEKEEEIFRNQKDVEDTEVVSIQGEEEEDLEIMMDGVAEDAAVKKDIKSKDLETAMEKKQRELEEQYQQRYAEACAQMEQQYQAQVLSMFTAPLAPMKGEGAAPTGTTAVGKAPMIGPFQRAPKEKLQTSPYSRNTDPARPNQMQEKLEASHGQRDGEG